MWGGIKTYKGEKTHCTQRDCVEWCGTEQEPGAMEQGL